MKEKALIFKKLLSNKRKIVITTHKGPDGDAMGSSLAILHILEKIGHNVHLIVPNNYADFLHWMPGNEKVVVFEDNEQFSNKISNDADLIIMLDFNNLSRIGNFKDAISNSNAKKVLIDHHQDPDLNIADIIFSDTKSSSTAQLVYEILKEMQLDNLIDISIAECIYVGIMTDSGSFKYSSTSARTHEIIAQLISLGVNNSKIHDLIYDNSSENRIRLLGYCLNNKLLIYKENNSAIISLSAEELDAFKFKSGDTEGFVNYALSIKGIKFATFIAEKEGIVKLSLRSKGDFKVNEIASKYFQGGGHINASGGISQVSINETIKKLEKIIIKYKNELKN